MCESIFNAPNAKEHHEMTTKGENYDLMGLL